MIGPQWEKMLNSRLYINHDLAFYNNLLRNVSFDEKLQTLARSARASYQNYLDEQKKLLEEKQIKKKTLEMHLIKFHHKGTFSNGSIC